MGGYGTYGAYGSHGSHGTYETYGTYKSHKSHRSHVTTDNRQPTTDNRQRTTDHCHATPEIRPPTGSKRLSSTRHVPKHGDGAVPPRADYHDRRQGQGSAAVHREAHHARQEELPARPAPGALPAGSAFQGRSQAR